MCDAYLKYVKYGTFESSDLEIQWYARDTKLLGHVQGLTSLARHTPFSFSRPVMQVIDCRCLDPGWPRMAERD